MDKHSRDQSTPSEDGVTAATANDASKATRPWPGLPDCRPGPSIVLVAPSGALNLGSVARVMRNFGLDDLRLVRAQVHPLHEDARRMAMRALATLETAAEKTYDTLGQALHGIHTVVATTSRRRGSEKAQEPLLPEAVFGEAIGRLAPQTDLDSGRGTAFVFGSEKSGLSNDDLAHAHLTMTLPTDPDFPSLNLAQAVGLVCYEMTRSGWLSAAPAHPSSEARSQGTRSGAALACGDAVENLLLEVGRWLTQEGFLLPHTRNARMHQLAILLRRARPTCQELGLLGAIARFFDRRASGRQEERTLLR